MRRLVCYFLPCFMSNHLVHCCFFYFTKNSAGVVDIPFQTSFVFQLFFLFGIVDGLRYFYHLGSFRAS